MKTKTPELKPCEPEPGPVHTLYNPYTARPPRVGVNFSDAPSLAQQQFRDECDINYVVKNFVQTGAIDPNILNKRAAMYGDVSDVNDLQSALDIVKAAQEGFDTLPADIRDRFKNDPRELLAFLDNPDNRQEAIDLGLMDGVKTTKEPPTAPPGTTPAT